MEVFVLVLQSTETSSDTSGPTVCVSIQVQSCQRLPEWDGSEVSRIKMRKECWGVCVPYVCVCLLVCVCPDVRR